MRRMRTIEIAAILVTAAVMPAAGARPLDNTEQFAVGAQYGTTHVYIAAADMDGFTASFLATFGGKSSQPSVVTVTPTPSTTNWQALTTPVGLVSLFGFTTPIPYPFGQERTGYLVTDMDAAVRAAKKAGAAVVVTPFPDAIGSDAVIQWPGGVNMQFYWHTKAPSYPPLQTIPENRVYVAPEAAASFIRRFVSFAHGKIVSDNAQAPGAEIGRPGDSYRRVRVESAFGKITVLVTDGHLPFPYGRETMGYEVVDVSETLTKAKASGASVLVGSFKADGREAAVLQFPGGYIAEIQFLGQVKAYPAQNGRSLSDKARRPESGAIERPMRKMTVVPAAAAAARATQAGCSISNNSVITVLILFSGYDCNCYATTAILLRSAIMSLLKPSSCKISDVCWPRSGGARRTEPVARQSSFNGDASSFSAPIEGCSMDSTTPAAVIAGSSKTSAIS